eukprot:1346862-Rhodomonas_salina.1
MVLTFGIGTLRTDVDYGATSCYDVSGTERRYQVAFMRTMRDTTGSSGRDVGTLRYVPTRSFTMSGTKAAEWC